MTRVGPEEVIRGLESGKQRGLVAGRGVIKGRVRPD